MSHKLSVVAIASLQCLAVGRPLAQSPSLVADIGAINVSQGSWPEEFTRVGRLVFYSAETRRTGRELFVLAGPDDVARTTSLVLDIRPGAASSSPRSLVALGGVLFFVADDGTNGFELWRSDGTTAGTVLVRDIRPGSAASAPAELCAVGGQLFFTADDGVNGRELWRSDGTAGGTALVQDIHPGSTGPGPSQLVAAGTRLFFAADDGVTGTELWQSDGTAAGTVLVRDIRPGPDHAAPDRMAALGNSVVFRANDGQTGPEPWVSDGTAAGTVRLQDIDPGSAGSDPDVMRRVGSTLYFFTRLGAMWQTDGTPQGTSVVTTVPGHAFDGVAFGQALVFIVLGSTSTTSSLWRSDGTAAGTYQLAAGWPLYGLTELRAIGSTIWFQGNVNSTANQGSLWQSDGTPAGTRLLTRIRAGTGPVDGGPAGFVQAADGRIVFAADDGRRGRELWFTDGTAAGTRLLADLEYDPTRTLASQPTQMVDLFGTALLVADDGSHGPEPWRTDGTAAGTQLLMDIRPGPEGSSAYGFARLGNSMLFAADDGTHGQELWVTDGTPAGTRLVKDITPGPGPSFPEELTPFHGEIWFAAANGLWRTDGTDPGTVLVAPVPAAELLVFGDLLLFAGQDPLRGTELWVSDGTAAGTTLLKDIDPVVTARGPESSTPRELVEFSGLVYFTAATTQYNGRDLWQTDGTAAGTSLVLDVEPGTSSIPFDLIAAGPRLFFSAGPLLGGYRFLWSSDGTAAGTARVTTRAIDPSQPRRLGDRLLFVARDPFQTELWISDGTDAGTQVVRDIHPTGSSRPAYLTAVGTRRVWFQADDGTHGNEVWVTDGTAAGTRLVADIDPRPVAGSAPYYSAGASYPWLFTLSGGQLLFAADDGLHGSEPWTLFPGATAQIVGEGCAPVGRPPSLSADDPVLGTTVTIAGDRAPTPAVGVIQVGLRLAQPVPSSWLPGCTIYGDPGLQITLPGFVPNGPRWSQTLALPNDPGLTSFRLALQAMFVILPPQPGYALTNGVYWTLGS